jgi:hypothetical protein
LARQNISRIEQLFSPIVKLIFFCFQAVVPTSVCDALQHAEAAQKERAEHARQNSRCVPILYCLIMHDETIHLDFITLINHRAEKKRPAHY